MDVWIDEGRKQVKAAAVNLLGVRARRERARSPNLSELPVANNYIEDSVDL